MGKGYVIALGRQYGCGGRKVGKLLAEKLGIGYYDNELLTLAAERSGVHEDFYKELDEKPVKFSAGLFSYAAPGAGSFYPVYDNIMVNDKLFVSQSEVIRQAAEEPCVIVGRCADYVLKDRDNLVSVFLHADIETRKRRLIEKYGVTDTKNMEKIIRKADKRRASYYNSYTDQNWGEATSYDLCINTGKMSIEKTADFIIAYLNQLSTD